MAATYGHFAKFFKNGTVAEVIGQLTTGINLAGITRWEMEFSIYINDDNASLYILNSGSAGSNKIIVNPGPDTLSVESGPTGEVTFAGEVIQRDGFHHIIIDYDTSLAGTEYGCIVDGVSLPRQATLGDSWGIMDQFGGFADNYSLSHFKIRTGASLATTLLELDASQVRDAAGTGWISRTDANTTPTNAAAEYDYTFYDVSGNDNHVTMYDEVGLAPYAGSWDFIVGITSINGQPPDSNPDIPSGGTIDIVAEGLNVTGVTVYPTAQPERTMTLSFTQTGSTISCTLPSVADNVANFLFAGASTVALTDGVAIKTVAFNHVPEAPYQAVTFAQGVITNEASALPFMADPVVGGDQCWYDPTYRKVLEDNTMAAVATPPWNYQEMLVDYAGSEMYAVTDGSAAAAVFFSGTIPTFSGVIGQPMSLDTSVYFDGSEKPFTYEVDGILPAGLDLDVTTGILSGTPSEVDTHVVSITAVDGAANTATSNGFNVNVAASVDPVGSTGVVPTQNLTSGGYFSFSFTSYFLGSEKPFTYTLNGTPPIGLNFNTNTGVLSGSTTDLGTFNLSVTATDTASNTATTNSFDVNITELTLSSGRRGLNDKLFEWLGGLGYTGNIADRWSKYLKDHT